MGKCGSSFCCINGSNCCFIQEKVITDLAKGFPPPPCFPTFSLSYPLRCAYKDSLDLLRHTNSLTETLRSIQERRDTWGSRYTKAFSTSCHPTIYDPLFSRSPPPLYRPRINLNLFSLFICYAYVVQAFIFFVIYLEYFFAMLLLLPLLIPKEPLWARPHHTTPPLPSPYALEPTHASAPLGGNLSRCSMQL